MTPNELADVLNGNRIADDVDPSGLDLTPAQHVPFALDASDIQGALAALQGLLAPANSTPSDINRALQDALQSSGGAPSRWIGMPQSNSEAATDALRQVMLLVRLGTLHPALQPGSLSGLR